MSHPLTTFRRTCSTAIKVTRGMPDRGRRREMATDDLCVIAGDG